MMQWERSGFIPKTLSVTDISVGISKLIKRAAHFGQSYGRPGCKHHVNYLDKTRRLETVEN